MKTFFSFCMNLKNVFKRLMCNLWEGLSGPWADALLNWKNLLINVWHVFGIPWKLKYLMWSKRQSLWFGTFLENIQTNMTVYLLIFAKIWRIWTILKQRLLLYGSSVNMCRWSKMLTKFWVALLKTLRMRLMLFSSKSCLAAWSSTFISLEKELKFLKTSLNT